MQSSSKQLVKNTSILYFRTGLMLIIGLYTSRVTMQTLGIENYGIINAVGGFVAMFSLLSGSLTASGQRFITYEIGRNKFQISQVFSATFWVFFILAIFLFIFAETAGLYFVNEVLNIPDGKSNEAMVVYQASVLSFLITMLNIPYNSIIVAYEKFDIFAYISLLEAILKLATVASLLIIPYNPLIVYSILTLISSIIIRSIFQIFCRKRFKAETRIENVKDKKLFTGIFKFAGWSFIGNTATILNNQGVNIIINIFCGVTLNAARGIATMIENVIIGFVNNFTTALNPQITKSYALKDYTKLLQLMDLGMRMSFFLMAIIAIPISIVLPNILQIWLGVVPDYTVSFVRICLISATIHAMANPFLTTILATGDIKKYQIIVGGITLINIPISYLLLKTGCKPIYVYYSALAIYLLTFTIRLNIIKRKLNLSIINFYKTITTRLFLIAILALGICFVLSEYFNTELFIQLLLYAVCSCGSIISIVYVIGLHKNEKKQIAGLIRAKLQKK